MSTQTALFIRGASGEPLRIVRAEGAYLVTADGRRILDGGAGAVVVNIGQAREEVAEAAARQLRELDYVVPVWTTPARERLVERLRRWTPRGLTRFFFTSGGSEAVEAAIKFALLYHARVRKNPAKKLILSRWLSYHGNTIAALSVSGNRARRSDYEHTLLDWPKIPPSYCYRCPWGKQYPGCGLECAEEIERVLERVGADSVAAFIAEPMVGASGGVIPPVSEYWPRIAELCKRNDVLLIADEVMTGFGRTGRAFGVDHYGVVPDLLVSAKGLTGGYMPMGMVAVREDLVEECEAAGADFMFFTYSAHPVACAVAEKVLEIMEREHLVARAAEIGARLGARLREAFASHPVVGDIRGAGLFWGLELVRDKSSREPFPPEEAFVNRVLAAALRRGLFFYPARGMADQGAGDAIMITPPFVIGENEIDLIVKVVGEALDEVCGDRLRSSLASRRD